MIHVHQPLTVVIATAPKDVDCFHAVAALKVSPDLGIIGTSSNDWGARVPRQRIHVVAEVALVGGMYR